MSLTKAFQALSMALALATTLGLTVAAVSTPVQAFASVVA
jgi:hypothetical protein